MTYYSIEEIKSDNPRWFDAETMTWFNSRIEPWLWQVPGHGAVFITSEQQGSEGFAELVHTASIVAGIEHEDAPPAPRMWTVRLARRGQVSTVAGGFGAYATVDDAVAAAMATAIEMGGNGNTVG